MMEVVSGDKWSHKTYKKLQPKTNTQLFTDRMPFPSTNQQRQSTERVC